MGTDEPQSCLSLAQYSEEGLHSFTTVTLTTSLRRNRYSASITSLLQTHGAISGGHACLQFFFHLTLPSWCCICESMILSIHVFDAILPPPGQWARLHQELQQLFERVAGLLIKKPEFRLVLFCYMESLDICGSVGN